MPDGKNYGLDEFLAERITFLRSIIDETDDYVLKQEIETKNLVFASPREYREWARDEIKKLTDLRISGVLDPNQYPSYTEYYQDWAANNGKWILGGKIWQSSDGADWLRKEYKGKDGIEAFVTPVDPASVKEITGDFYETNKGQLTQKDIWDMNQDWYNYQQALVNSDVSRQMWQYEQGKSAEKTAYEQAKTAEETAYGRAQWENETSYARAKAELDRHFAQIEADKQRALSERSLSLQERDAMARSANEQARIRLEREGKLAALKANPADWIERWYFENEPQMAAQKREQVDWLQARNELPDIENRVSEQRGYFTSKYGAMPEENIKAIAGSQSTTDPDIVLAARALLQWEGKKQSAQTLSSQPSPQTNTTSLSPPAPAWLPTFASQQIMGQPITSQYVESPSPVTWMKTAPTAKEGLRGYLNWSGNRSYEDLVSQMTSMIPESPSGVNYKRWLPKKQYA